MNGIYKIVCTIISFFVLIVKWAPDYCNGYRYIEEWTHINFYRRTDINENWTLQKLTNGFSLKHGNFSRIVATFPFGMLAIQVRRCLNEPFSKAFVWVGFGSFFAVSAASSTTWDSYSSDPCGSASLIGCSLNRFGEVTAAAAGPLLGERQLFLLLSHRIWRILWLSAVVYIF